jgi:hypothetical protein
VALNERDPSGRHQFRDADAKTRVDSGTDYLINGCADAAQPSGSEARTGGAATRRVAPP